MVSVSRACRILALSLIALVQPLTAQTWSDWIPTSMNTQIEYRLQVFPNMRQCYLEFHDKQQGKGTTTFDVSIDYKFADPNGNLNVKTDREHVVTLPSQVGTVRVVDCVGVSEVRASTVVRH